MRTGSIGVCALVFLAFTAAAAAQETTAPEAQVQPVIAPDQVQSIEVRLQNQLDRVGGAHIDHCGPVLRLVAPDSSGINRTDGASCALQTPAGTVSALMCEGARAGQFALTLTPVADLGTMRRFFVDNCYPPG
jgi:hypothetical protein